MPYWNGLKRTPVKKKRAGTRRGQATPEEVKAIRDARYEMAGGRCELGLSDFCIKGVLPKDGLDPWSHGHLVHLKAKRRHGTTLEDSRWGCWHCHLVGLHNPKSVPPKFGVE
jgi:hypothetical protein